MAGVARRVGKRKKGDASPCIIEDEMCGDLVESVKIASSNVKVCAVHNQFEMGMNAATSYLSAVLPDRIEHKKRHNK